MSTAPQEFTGPIDSETVLLLLEERGFAIDTQSLHYWARAKNLSSPNLVNGKAYWPPAIVDQMADILEKAGKFTLRGAAERYLRLEPGSLAAMEHAMFRDYAGIATILEVHPRIGGSPAFVRLRPMSLGVLQTRAALTE